MIHVDLRDFCFQHNEDCEHLFKHLSSKGLLIKLTFEIISILFFNAKYKKILILKIERSLHISGKIYRKLKGLFL